MRPTLPACAAVVVLALGACAPPPGPVYSRNEAHSAWNIRDGRVVDVRPATIEGRRSAIGRVGGGAIGYEVAHTVGHGAGSDIAGAVGGVAGAIAGEAVEEAATRQRAYEITVELDGGHTMMVVQPADQDFAPGERVKVYTRHGDARVAKR